MLLPEGNKLKCARCGKITEGEIVSVESSPQQVNEVGIISEMNPAAKFDNVCKKCGYNKAELIIHDPVISDEDAIIMLKCGKCNAVENLTRKMT